MKLRKPRWMQRKSPPVEGDDWITVPFRFAESARVSIYTIGSSPAIPDEVRWWIAQWLTAYNNHLVWYMQENYGPSVFPILDRITTEVMPPDRGTSEAAQDSWEHWEKQFKEEQ